MTHPPDHAERAREVAAGLTKARRAMILALPADGGWGSVPSRSVAKRAWWNMLPGVIAHKHCPEDANQWALSDFGLAVRAALHDAKETVLTQRTTAGIPKP